FVDCEYRDNPVPISQITVSGGVATVTTSLPHGRANGAWVRIGGATVGGSTDNSFNGSYTISNVTTYGFQYTPSPTQTSNPTGDMWVGKFSSHIVAITNIGKTDPVPPATGPYVITVTTNTAHFRVPGNNVSVNQVTPLGY